MENHFVLFSSFTLGYLLRNLSVLPSNFALSLNKILIYFFLPVLILLHLSQFTFDIVHIWLLITPWIIYGCSLLFFEAVHQLTPIPKKVRAALIMTSGIGSISFVGFPFFKLFYGDEGLSYGIVMSIAGTLVVCNSVGILTGYWYAQEQPKPSVIVKKIVQFPPFIAMFIAMWLLFFDYEHHSSTKSVLTFLSSPFSVLALFTIGLQVQLKGFGENRKFLWLGQFYKLVLAPVLIYMLFFFLGLQHTLIAKICILGAGIGSMNTIAIVAVSLNLRPKLALLMPGVGIPLSVGTLMLLYYLIC